MTKWLCGMTIRLGSLGLRIYGKPTDGATGILPILQTFAVKDMGALDRHQPVCFIHSFQADRTSW
jgi:hypothetical protein